MHQHDEHCGCGEHLHNHEHSHHEHDEHCGCGEHHHEHEHGHHHHEHDEHCGCGEHNHEHCSCGHDHAPIAIPEDLSNVQVEFLIALRQRHCLPVACLAFAKADDASRYMVALEPVYLTSADDTMEQVKQLSYELAHLEEQGLITLDYDIPLRNYAYQEYTTSALYALFKKTVAEAAERPDATFDTAKQELGSMALTDAGEALVDTFVK